jgi:RND family efflux transporter MFP subunit
MKKWLIPTAVAICIICTVLTGCSRAEMPPATVAVTRGDLAVTVSTEEGHLKIRHDVRKQEYLSFSTSGEVAEVLVEKGDRVVTGQVLARLDTVRLEQSVQTAQTRVEAARIGYEIARTQLMGTIYPMYTGAYISDLPGTWLALEEIEGYLKETRSLLEKGKAEQARIQLEAVEAGVAKAKEKLHSKRWPLPLSVRLVELQADQAKTALDLAELDLASAMLDLEGTTIAAPFDAEVADVYIYAGQQLSAVSFTGPAFYLIDPGRVEMTGDVNELDIPLVQPDQEAVIAVDALPGLESTGKVTYIAPMGEVWEDEVSYEVTLSLNNPGDKLMDGMSATARIIVDRRESVLLVPNEAVQGSFDSPWVEVLTDGEAEQRSIALGPSDGSHSEVLSGLKEGEQVLLRED